MKQVGFAARLLAVVAVLALTAFVVAGCGSDNNKSSTSDNSAQSTGDSGSTGSGGSSSDANSGPTKNLNGQTVGASKKVVVKSDQDMSAEQQAVVDRIGQFGDATATKNYKKLCTDLLSKQARKIGGNCIRTFSQTGAQLKDFNITVESVKISSDGKTATAKVGVTSNVAKQVQNQTLSLVKEDGDWRIQILGQ